MEAHACNAHYAHYEWQTSTLISKSLKSWAQISESGPFYLDLDILIRAPLSCKFWDHRGRHVYRSRTIMPIPVTRPS